MSQRLCLFYSLQSCVYVCLHVCWSVLVCSRYLCSSLCLYECICEYAVEFVYATLNRSVVYVSMFSLCDVAWWFCMWKNLSATERVFHFSEHLGMVNYWLAIGTQCIQIAFVVVALLAFTYSGVIMKEWVFKPYQYLYQYQFPFLRFLVLGIGMIGNYALWCVRGRIYMDFRCVGMRRLHLVMSI